MSEEQAPAAEPSWRDAIPEQYREMGVVKEADSMDAVFQRVKDLNDYRGNSIRIPSEDAGSEQMVEFTQKLAERVPGLIKIPEAEAEGYADIMSNVYQQLGRPGEASGYQIPEAPEGVNMEAEAFQAFGELAHSLGLNQKQFEALAKRELEMTLAGQQAQSQGVADTEAKMKTEWGQAFEGRSTLIKDFLTEFFPSVKDTPLTDFGLDTCNEFIALAEKLNAEGGPSIDAGLKGAPAGALTPAEAQAQISDIRNNSQHPYHNRMDPGHAAAQEKMRKLYEAAYGTNPTGSGVSMSFNV